MEFITMSDEDLVATWMDIREQVEAQTPQQLELDQDVPDESVRLLTDLNLAAKERVRRRIPPVDSRGNLYEVQWEEQTSDSAVTFRKDRFERREDAIARAVEIGRATREALGLDNE